MGLNGGDIDETIVPIVSGNCVRMIRGAEFGDTRNLEMRRSSPVGQMEAELTCSKYPLGSFAHTGGAFWKSRLIRLVDPETAKKLINI